VPKTALVKISDPNLPFHYAGKDKGDLSNAHHHLVTKLGSFQEFVRHDYDASEHGTNGMPVSDVHRIGILDLRILNTDRHSGNLLIRTNKTTEPSMSITPTSVLANVFEEDAAPPIEAPKRPTQSSLLANCKRLTTQMELIPIDHGNCLPHIVEAPYFEWLHWPQAAMPFSAEELKYIASLDAQRDVEMLRQEIPGLREECLRLLEVTTMVLQKAAAGGMSLAQIGSLFSRNVVGINEEPSELEKVSFNIIFKYI